MEQQNNAKSADLLPGNLADTHQECFKAAHLKLKQMRIKLEGAHDTEILRPHVAKAKSLNNNADSDFKAFKELYNHYCPKNATVEAEEEETEPLAE